tara:strand:- start:889 stop:1239 length:351 start_codon:yes stop_codon:yes gene_type:complete
VTNATSFCRELSPRVGMLAAPISARQRPALTKRLFVRHRVALISLTAYHPSKRTYERVRVLLSLSSPFMSSSSRRDLRILSYWFAGCLLLMGADVAAQHAFLECADRAPAFSKVCK